MSRVVVLGVLALSACVTGARGPGPRVEGATPHYRVLVHSELGMHCTGFDFSYCCVLPPYSVDTPTLLRDYLDPRVPRSGPDRGSGVLKVWDRRGERMAPVGLLQANAQGGPVLTPPDVDGDRSVVVASADPLAGTPGVVAPYDALTDGKDYWLSAGEPHCADCHTPPFVESEGGRAFPIDQPGKYALMRFSSGHAGIHCQGCHGSAHGLHPVTPKVDTGSYAQAAANNPDGTHGPTKCAACHAVNAEGVPTLLADAEYRDKALAHDYDLAVEYAHTMRNP